MDLKIFIRGEVVSIPRTPRVGEWDEQRKLPRWQMWGITLNGNVFVGSRAWSVGDDLVSLRPGVDYFSVQGLQLSHIVNYDEFDPMWRMLQRVTLGSHIRARTRISWSVRKGATYPNLQVGLLEELEVIELGSVEGDDDLSLSRFADMSLVER